VSRARRAGSHTVIEAVSAAAADNPGMAALSRVLRAAVIVVLAGLVAPAPLALAQTAPEQPLQLSISGTPPNLNLSWLAENGVAYQLESSADFSTWSDLGPVTVGGGGPISVPLSIVGQTQGFFRLKRLPAVAVFNPATGVLTVNGNDLDNTIVLSRDPAGNLLVNRGAITITGGTPTVANTTLIEVHGNGGNDVISLDESNGAMPRANLFGEDGNDTLTGGSGDDPTEWFATQDALAVVERLVAAGVPAAVVISPSRMGLPLRLLASLPSWMRCTQ